MNYFSVTHTYTVCMYMHTINTGEVHKPIKTKHAGLTTMFCIAVWMQKNQPPQETNICDDSSNKLLKYQICDSKD